LAGLSGAIGGGNLGRTKLSGSVGAGRKKGKYSQQGRAWNNGCYGTIFSQSHIHHFIIRLARLNAGKRAARNAADGSRWRRSRANCLVSGQQKLRYFKYLTIGLKNAPV
jgi:hypothetical protein